MTTAKQQNRRRPFNNCYWVVPGELAAGEYPGSLNSRNAEAKMEALLDAGITKFIDLTEDGELNPYKLQLSHAAEARGIQIEHKRHSIVDLSTPRRRENMVNILNAIDVGLTKRQRVYVHCWGGVGRTGTVIGCWLVRHGRSGDDALTQISEWWQDMEKIDRRPQSPETAGQRRYVREWKEES